MTVYLVEVEYRVDGENGFEVTNVCFDRNKALAIMKEKKDEDLADWRQDEYLGEENAVVIENDTEDLFQMQVNYWDEYVEWRVVDKQVED